MPKIETIPRKLVIDLFRLLSWHASGRVKEYQNVTGVVAAPLVIVNMSVASQHNNEDTRV